MIGVYVMLFVFIPLGFWLRKIVRECDDADARIRRRLADTKRFHVQYEKPRFHVRYERRG